MTLRILAIVASLNFQGQREIILVYVSPVAGTAYVDARCWGQSWQSGYVNAPCVAGTNTITLRAGCETGGALRVRVQQ